MSKTPYEIRLELIKLAKETLSESFHMMNERFYRQHDNSRGIDFNIKDAPKYPTTDQIIDQAEEFNSFVSTEKPRQKSKTMPLISDGAVVGTAKIDIETIDQLKKTNNEITLNDAIEKLKSKSETSHQGVGTGTKESEATKQMKETLHRMEIAEAAVEREAQILEDANNQVIMENNKYAPKANPYLINEFDIGTRKIYPENPEENIYITEKLKDLAWPDIESLRAHILKKYRQDHKWVAPSASRIITG